MQEVGEAGKSPCNEVKYSSHIEIFSVISLGGN